MNICTCLGTMRTRSQLAELRLRLIYVLMYIKNYVKLCKKCVRERVLNTR